MAASFLFSRLRRERLFGAELCLPVRGGPDDERVSRRQAEPRRGRRRLRSDLQCAVRLGQHLHDDLDCSSVFCSAVTCIDQTCSDNLKNQDESDVDCGGTTGYAPCASGKACLSDSDCASASCASNICRAPQTCSDKVKDHDESDVDCGGMTGCNRCTPGKACLATSDCDGGACSGCARCAVNQHCQANTDCDHAGCSKGTCQPTSCTDRVLNGSETDVDCGGSCEGCAPLAACLVAKDCASLVCTLATHKCAAPTCSDGVLNGTEPTVDCGASCPNKCRIGDTCGASCLRGRCMR
jgi:hypothetical protein